MNLKQTLKIFLGGKFSKSQNWGLGQIKRTHPAELPPTNQRDQQAPFEDVSVQSGQIFESKGLVSIDRSKVAALLSTTPRLQTRSSTNDLAPLHRMGWISLRHRPATLNGSKEPRCCGLTTAGAEVGRPASIVASQRRGANNIVTYLGGILT